MPQKNGIGYGKYTPVKIDHFVKIVRAHLAITQAVLTKHQAYYNSRYIYLDLTSGCGVTPNGIKGCALAFAEQATSESVHLRTSMVLIECDPKNALELESKLEEERKRNSWQNIDWRINRGKYQDIVPQIINSVNNDFGLIFVDHSGNMPDFEILNHLTKYRPKMELLIYISSTNIKRLFPYTNKKLIDIIDGISKKYWLIREPIKRDKHKWTYLLGTNAKDLFKDFKEIKLFRANTDKGQEILRELNLTEKEIFEQDQPSLF